MTCPEVKRAGVNSRKQKMNVMYDLHSIQRFYYCLQVSAYLYMNDRLYTFPKNSLEVNLYLMKWLDNALHLKIWDDSVLSEIRWLMKSLSASPFKHDTLIVVANIHDKILAINNVRM